MRIQLLFALFFASVILLLEVQPAVAVTVVIDGRANIYGAGKLAPPAPAGGGAGVLPPAVSFPASPNTIIQITDATGSVGTGPNPLNGPDGANLAGFSTIISSFEGISGITHTGPKAMFLVGVFLDTSVPSDPAPPILDVTNDSFLTVNPLLGQTFFIGDGLTGTGSGTQQQFIAPNGATRLFLGLADGSFFQGAPGFYDDNFGSYTVTVDVSGAGLVPSLTGGWLLVLVLSMCVPILIASRQFRIGGSGV